MVSSNIEKAAMCATATSAFIHPFQRAGVLLPVLPTAETLQALLELQIPYLIG
jgi:hypothetical protein